MFIQPIDDFLAAWFVLAVASTAYVAWDQFSGNREPVVMKWGFVLVTLYMGPLGLLLYVMADKELRPGAHEEFIRPLWKQAWARRSTASPETPTASSLRRSSRRCWACAVHRGALARSRGSQRDGRVRRHHAGADRAGETPGLRVHGAPVGHLPLPFARPSGSRAGTRFVWGPHRRPERRGSGAQGRSRVRHPAAGMAAAAGPDLSGHAHGRRPAELLHHQWQGVSVDGHPPDEGRRDDQAAIHRRQQQLRPPDARARRPFTVVAIDGNVVQPAARFDADTVNVGPGQRYDVLWTAREPGKWLIHSHIPHHTTNDNVEEHGGGGLMMVLDVSG